MFKRNSIARDDSNNELQRINHVSYPTVTKFSKNTNTIDFLAMTGTQRPVQQYDIVIPDYVTITYEVMIWTDFTEHMNKLVELPFNKQLMSIGEIKVDINLEFV